MIEIKPPDDEKKDYSEIIEEKLHPEAYYMKEISKTLKEILREMRKRKV